MRPEADSKIVARVQVPGYSGRAIAVDAGNMVRVTDVCGSQVADLFAIARDTSGEYLCTARTRAVTLRLFPQVGQQFVTNLYRPILTFISDHSPGKHDTLFASCDPGLHWLLGAAAPHPNCHENFLKAIREVGVDLGLVPGPVNLFQNTPVQADGTLGVERAPTQAGDYVEFRVELDAYLVVTACSVDTAVDINGGMSTPLLVEVCAPSAES